MKKYYMVLCHRGHCGSGNSTEIKFAIEAENLIEACDKARKMPSVKHTRLAIYGKEISKSEYEEYRKKSAYERFPQHRAREYKRRY
jgi:hypothetical protein